MRTPRAGKASVIAEYRQHETDTGSPEVQVSILTSRIRELTEHLKANKKDKHTQRGIRTASRKGLRALWLRCRIA